MKKPLQDAGTHVAASKPVKLPSYPPQKLPDAAECVGCLIVVNDPRDAHPRGYLALSNGASWDKVGAIEEPGLSRLVAQAMPVSAVVKPQAVEVLPPQPVLAPPTDHALKHEMARQGAKIDGLERERVARDHEVQRLMQENEDLRARLARLEGTMGDWSETFEVIAQHKRGAA